MLGGGSCEPHSGLVTISQALPAVEAWALTEAWGCRVGPWEEAGVAAVMDGWLREGTGRFSGEIGRERES
jgi:hypothetical protein